MKKIILLPLLFSLIFSSCSRNSFSNRENGNFEDIDNKTTSDNNSSSNNNTNNDTNTNSEDESSSSQEQQDTPSDSGTSDEPIDVDGEHEQEPQDPVDPDPQDNPDDPNPQDPDNPPQPQDPPEEEEEEEDTYAPNPEPIDIETELEPNYTSFSIDRTDLELDCGKDRTNNSTNEDTNMELLPYFKKSDSVTCTFSSQFDYQASRLSVYWFIDEIDNDYFALTGLSEDNFGNQVTVTAKKESRLSTLTAALVLDKDKTKVLKTLTCQLRSVMINVQSIAPFYPGSFYAGRSTSTLDNRFDNKISFFKRKYNENEDIVIPSIIRLDSSYNSICYTRQLGTFYTKDGDDVSLSTEPTICRNLFIPRTVISITNLYRIKVTNSAYIEESSAKFLYFERNSCLYQGNPAEKEYFYQSMLILPKLHQPYTKSAERVNSDDSSLNGKTITTIEKDNATYFSASIVTNNVGGVLLYNE